jgi:penicillin G amidase
MRMNRGLRIGLIVVLVALVALFLVATITAVTIMRRPFPKANGTLQVAGLSQEVEVIRDEFGVPHIYAQNERDLFFAQGFVHAQDRFWQMEFWRHVGQGRISEIAGEGALENDLFIRNIGWNRIAADTLAMYEQEEPEVMAILEAYSAGVNAYIEQNRNRLSLNQTILDLVNERRSIEPWTPLNTISWGVVMAWDLSGNWQHEQTRALLTQELGEAAVVSLLPLYPENRPVIVETAMITETARYRQDYSARLGAIDWANLDTQLIGAVPETGFAFGNIDYAGSNSWVVDGRHTESGLPLLANDPHLGIQMPSIWYEVGLYAPGWNVVGFSFAGAPGVVIGHNERIAWGVTTAPVDVQDLFIERVNPSNPLQYEFQGNWLDMEVLQEVIRINGGEDVVLEVRQTRHGPILNEAREGIRDVLAFRWNAQTPSRLIKSILLLNQAANYDDFVEATRYWDTAVQNIIYADVEGNIAYQLPGRIPVRRNGDGLLPVPGWTGEYQWEGWIPFEELPAALNPPEGYIVTANNRVTGDQYPHLLSFYWADGDRAQRIVDLLEAGPANGGRFTVDDFARIQNDNYSMLAATYVPLFGGLRSDDARVQAALERMRGWDYQLRRDSVPATLFEIFYMHLTAAALADELGGGADHYLSNGDIQRIFFHALARQPDAHWWNNRWSDRRESREDILLQAIGEAVTWLEDNLGSDMNTWTWGRLHTATFVSAPLGQSNIGAIEAIVNRGPYPADGGSSIVNANGWSWSNPAAIRGHVSMRMIVDMSNYDASLAIHSTGQSGHPYHRHYDDMIPLWLDGRYHAMLWSREAVAAAAAQRLILRPGSSN